MKSDGLMPGDKISRRELLTLAWCRNEIPAASLELSALKKDTEPKLSLSGDSAVAGTAPFGKLGLDRSRCSGCGLCALNCPRGALFTSSDEATSVYRLLFNADACVACDRCVVICPEKCLHLERCSEPDKACRRPLTLFEDDVVRCCQCGSAIAPRAMLNNLSAKVLAAGQGLSAQLELCATCRVKSSICDHDGSQSLFVTRKG